MANQRNLEKNKYKPGQSGNPKGRPRKVETLAHIRELLTAFENETDKRNRSNLQKQIAKLSRSEAGIKLLWEYWLGKVPQPIVGDKDAPLKVLIEYADSDDQTPPPPLSTTPDKTGA